MVISGLCHQLRGKYRHNFVYIHACIVTVRTSAVSETSCFDESHELDENGVSANTMGLMLGSVVAG